MKFVRDMNIAGFEAVTPALFFAGYFFCKPLVFLIGALLFILFAVHLKVKIKRVAILFSIFLLFSGSAIRSRDNKLPDNAFFNRIKNPELIEIQRKKLISSVTLTRNRQLLRALAIGEREFSEKFRDSLIVTGTMHLVAISAFHTGIMIMLINFIFRIIFVFIPLKYSMTVFFSLGVKLVASIYYFYLTGGSIPTLRALVFILAYDTVYGSNKKPDSLTLYFFSLTGVSVLIPQSASSISFMMSALCVATVLNVWNKLPGSLTIRIVVLSILINYVLIPVNAVLTGCYSLYSPFVNLLVIPLVSFAVPFISLAQFSVFISDSLASGFLQIADVILSPVVFHINLWSEISTELMMPLTNPPFFVKVIFTVSFFLSIMLHKNLKLLVIPVNIFTFFLFIFSPSMKPVRVVTPSSLYGKAKCVVFPDSSGDIYFEPLRNNPSATIRFYHRMEKAAAECGINKLKSITSKHEFHQETIKKIKQRYRFKNTVFKTYLPDRSFDRNQHDGSSPLLNGQVQ